MPLCLLQGCRPGRGCNATVFVAGMPSRRGCNATVFVAGMASRARL